MTANIGKPAADLRLAFIQASWHESIVDRCRASFTEEISAYGVGPGQIDVFRVPGAFEIPLVATRAIRSGRYDAIVASALVVDGGIYRHEFVATAVIDGLMRAQLDGDVPVISAVLTPHHFHDSDEHRRFFAEHFVVKGAEAARACVGALAALAELASVTAP